LPSKAKGRAGTAAVAATRRQVERELATVADAKRAKGLAWFFKTGKGEYGEGDRFIGITVPAQRTIALRYSALPLDDIAGLLASSIHEHRFTALEILVAQYARADEKQRARIFRFYLGHAHRANNWDLVDTSAPYIVGEHLKKRPRHLLDRLAASRNVWKRRIAIVSTLALIREGEIEDTFRIAENLLSDRHDLIHKAVGWMLREAGKNSPRALLKFLRSQYSSIPRTTLRYAIERFPATYRAKILAGHFD
jgi:3-methyladenine DNA glycosylase AlkD